ncbi:hypothetical protein SBRCBS47491_006410 [Sporothrix bragantina]|uniref:Uncharacterized protein n=1 Tax=Sporothrix bragantina TaxID=671064 RepID=A0ABP0C4S6_9PEZI
MENSEHVCEDLLDTVESYHKVARKRFADLFASTSLLGRQLENLEEAIKVLRQLGEDAG